MEVINICGLVTCVFLALSGWIYGAKFLKKGNYLLGFEWWIVAFSASNFVMAMLTASEINYAITLFLDSFSRSFGMPIIAVLGLMVLTHNYKPPVSKEVMLFAAAFAGTFVVYLSDFFDDVRPYFYVIMWFIYSVYMVYFIARLARIGEAVHAIASGIGTVAALAVAIAYDFFPIPGDDTHMIFMTLAFTVWSYGAIQLYYAYCALERAKADESRLLVSVGRMRCG
ncbi:hypothetical protein [Stutzerimonas stutzeri]|uniref:hypothetical protein n=1 Tax=Stutzerimonas stutzeri TaxID=316 RepID=UPI0030138801